MTDQAFDTIEAMIDDAIPEQMRGTPDADFYRLGFRTALKLARLHATVGRLDAMTAMLDRAETMLPEPDTEQPEPAFLADDGPAEAMDLGEALAASIERERGKRGAGGAE